MPDLAVLPLSTVQQPVQADTKKLWTTETARLAARRSAEVRAARVLARKQGLSLPTQPIIQPAKPPHNPRLELVREQISLTRKVLNDEDYAYCQECERGGMPAHHRAALLRALDTLLDRERKMLGISDPGTLKPQQPRRARSGPMADPQPTPQEQPPATGQNG